MKETRGKAIFPGSRSYKFNGNHIKNHTNWKRQEGTLQMVSALFIGPSPGQEVGFRTQNKRESSLGEGSG